MEFLVSLCMGIVCLLVVCGNIFVLYVLVSQPSLHTSTNFLVLSLTISDLLLGTVILPFAIIQEHRKEWLFGDVGCRLWLTVDVWLSTASIYNLLAISFDRYMAVRQPIRYPIISSKKVTRLMVAVVWAFSGLLGSCLFILESLDGSPKQECSPMKLPSLYILFSALASFIVPAVIMVVLNVSIFRTVLTTSRTKCVSVTSGASMRIHRGRRKSAQKASIFIILKRFSEDSSDSKEKHKLSTEIPVTALIEKEKQVDLEQPIESPTFRTLFNHVMVVSMISTTKKRSNIMSQLSGDRARVRFSRLSMRTELRVARTTAVVVAAFIICWFPFTTIYTLQVK
uniref:G_PROTEIN_RECEP_F1_2 domain-containing protein n=1 Tax=Heterorhabditis bacteriophora TaxID=37862 RepID=A0A1I7XD88_HETBA